MTEAEWWACADPAPMLTFLERRASARKLRLFAVACYRHLHSFPYQERSHSLLALAERLADGQALPAELKEARRIAYPVGLLTTIEPNLDPAIAALLSPISAACCGKAEQAGCLRELFGNPFAVRAVDASWLRWNGGTVPHLARAIY